MGPEHLFIAYLVASAIVIATPGQDSLTVLSLGLVRGRREAMQFALGVGTGCLTHTLWAAMGVGALVAASEQLFSLLKLAGAAYLLWLGIGALRSAGKHAVSAPSKRNAGAPGATPEPGAGVASAPVRGRTRFVQGFFSNSLNPKVMLFFIAFLPQFVDPAGAPISWQLAELGAGFAAMTAVSYVALGAASARVGDLFLRRPSLARALDRTVGVLFIGLAARLALDQRT